MSIREREGDHSCGYRDGIRRVHAALDEAGRPGADTWPAATRVQRLLTDHRGAVEAFAQERQAVLDCVNLYGDETLHKALDAIGWPGDYIGGQ